MTGGGLGIPPCSVAPRIINRCLAFRVSRCAVQTGLAVVLSGRPRRTRLQRCRLRADTEARRSMHGEFHDAAVPGVRSNAWRELGFGRIGGCDLLAWRCSLHGYYASQRSGRRVSCFGGELLIFTRHRRPATALALNFAEHATCVTAKSWQTAPKPLRPSVGCAPSTARFRPPLGTCFDRSCHMSRWTMAHATRSS